MGTKTWTTDIARVIAGLLSEKNWLITAPTEVQKIAIKYTLKVSIGILGSSYGNVTDLTSGYGDQYEINTASNLVWISQSVITWFWELTSIISGNSAGDVISVVFQYFLQGSNLLLTSFENQLW